MIKLTLKVFFHFIYVLISNQYHIIKIAFSTSAKNNYEYNFFNFNE